MPPDITDFSPAALRLRLNMWLVTGGEEELAELMATHEKSKHAIRDALRPDPDTLSKPMTI